VTIQNDVLQRYRISAETYWRELCLNLDFQERLYGEALNCTNMQVVELDGTYETGQRRTLRFQKRIDAPLAIRKLVGDTVTLEEVSEWNARDRTWSFRMVQAALSDRLDIRGVIRVEDHAEGVTQTSRNIVTCRIFGIGGLIEHFVAKSTKEASADKAAFARRYIEERGLTLGDAATPPSASL
jgi:hypothetical protein